MCTLDTLPGGTESVTMCAGSSKLVLITANPLLILVVTRIIGGKGPYLLRLQGGGPGKDVLEFSRYTFRIR